MNSSLSAKAAAEKVYGETLTESVIPSPKGPYGESKQQAEQYLLRHQPPEGSGKSVYILRPCMIHGPGNKGNLNLLYQVVKKGIPWPLGAFENRRSFCSIGNLNFVIGQLLEKEIEPGIYNLADDESLSTTNLYSLWQHHAAKRPGFGNSTRNLFLSQPGWATNCICPSTANG